MFLYEFVNWFGCEQYDFDSYNDGLDYYVNIVGYVDGGNYVVEVEYDIQYYNLCDDGGKVGCFGFQRSGFLVIRFFKQFVYFFDGFVYQEEVIIQQYEVFFGKVQFKDLKQFVFEVYYLGNIGQE